MEGKVSARQGKLLMSLRLSLLICIPGRGCRLDRDLQLKLGLKHIRVVDISFSPEMVRGKEILTVQASCLSLYLIKPGL